MVIILFISSRVRYASIIDMLKHYNMTRTGLKPYFLQKLAKINQQEVFRKHGLETVIAKHAVEAAKDSVTEIQHPLFE